MIEKDKNKDNNNNIKESKNGYTKIKFCRDHRLIVPTRGYVFNVLNKATFWNSTLTQLSSAHFCLAPSLHWTRTPSRYPFPGHLFLNPGIPHQVMFRRRIYAGCYLLGDAVARSFGQVNFSLKEYGSFALFQRFAPRKRKHCCRKQCWSACLQSRHRFHRCPRKQLQGLHPLPDQLSRCCEHVS